MIPLSPQGPNHAGELVALELGVLPGASVFLHHLVHQLPAGAGHSPAEMVRRHPHHRVRLNRLPSVDHAIHRLGDAPKVRAVIRRLALGRRLDSLAQRRHLCP